MPGGLAKAYAGGGDVKHFLTGGTTGTTTLPANVTGTQAGLSNWAGDYATNLLGQGQALAMPGLLEDEKKTIRGVASATCASPGRKSAWPGASSCPSTRSTSPTSGSTH